MKLKELITVTYSDIDIMNGIDVTFIICNEYDTLDYLSEKLLNSEIYRIEARGNNIRVWLEEEKNNE